LQENKTGWEKYEQDGGVFTLTALFAAEFCQAL
jgi:hypothetical protein